MDPQDALLCFFEEDEDGYEEPLPTHVFHGDVQYMPCTAYGGVLCYKASIQHERWRAMSRNLAEQKLSESMRDAVFVLRCTFYH